MFKLNFTIKNTGDAYSSGSMTTAPPTESLTKDIVIENIDDNTSRTFSDMQVPLDDNR